MQKRVLGNITEVGGSTMEQKEEDEVLATDAAEGDTSEPEHPYPWDS